MKRCTPAGSRTTDDCGRSLNHLGLDMQVIGIDSGTQGTKALVVDFDTGTVLGRGFSPHALVEGLPPGHSEQDPQTWVRALESALSQALRDSGCSGRSVVSLGVSGQQHGFVPLDGAGEPIRPAKLWNDTSTQRETEDILARLGGRRGFVEKLGIGLAVGFTASKILWFRRHEAVHYRNLATILLPHNYLNYYLTGRLHMEYGDASGTGLMDIRNRKWSGEALAAIDPALESMLPPLAHPREPCGYVREAIASRFGFGKVLVSSGGGDNMMGAIGTGNVVEGVCTLSLGTSGTLCCHRGAPLVDPRGDVSAFCDSTGGWLPLLCTMNVTNTTELVKSLLGVSSEELERLAAQAGPGAAGLIFLPYIDGERVPALPNSNGVLLGLGRHNFNPEHLARAVLEGTMLNLGFGLALMRNLGLATVQIRATGGGARNRLWLQLAADILECRVATLEETEAAAYGAALQSIWAWHIENGEGPGIEEIVKPRVKLGALRFEPNAGVFEAYRLQQRRFNALWKALLDSGAFRPPSSIDGTGAATCETGCGTDS